MKTTILLRIQYFKQGGCGIPVGIAANLINLIQHVNRVG